MTVAGEHKCPGEHKCQDGWVNNTYCSCDVGQSLELRELSTQRVHAGLRIAKAEQEVEEIQLRIRDLEILRGELRVRMAEIGKLW